MSEKLNDHKNVLSLDGGGVRTLAQVTFLKKLEETTGKTVFDLFDFFTGISAGGINTLHIALNKFTAIDLENFWSKENFTLMLNKSFWNRRTFFSSKPIYDENARTELLKNNFQKKLLTSSIKPVTMIAYDVEKRKPKILRSYEKSNITALSAAKATSAAPLYYPTTQVEDGSWLIDGVVVVSNPCLVAYNEARKFFKTDKIKIFSIGSGINRKKIDGKLSTEWGPIGWLRNDILGIMLQSSLHDEILEDMIGNNYLRINSEIGEVNPLPDDHSEENLQKVRAMGDNWWNRFGEKFMKLLLEK